MSESEAAVAQTFVDIHDELNQLRSTLAARDAEVAGLKSRLDEFGKVMVNVVPGEDGEGEEVPATPESILGLISQLQSEWDGAEKRYFDARSALAEAREIVRPFAEYAVMINKWFPGWSDDGGVSSMPELFSHPEICLPELGIFRRAAAFLAKENTDGQ